MFERVTTNILLTSLPFTRARASKVTVNCITVNYTPFENTRYTRREHRRANKDKGYEREREEERDGGRERGRETD